MKKQQVIVIGGGEMFSTYEEYLEYLHGYEINLEPSTNKWKDELLSVLGEDYEVIRIHMPNDMNAKYIEWEIWFKKYIPLMQDETFLVGHSLGGIFLVKYLSENDFPKQIKGLFLVAPPFDDIDADYSLVDFNLGDNFSRLQELGDRVHLYHSTDDPMVSFADLEKYRKHLPNAQARTFSDKGHFLVPEFPEIVDDIQNLE